MDPVARLTAAPLAASASPASGDCDGGNLERGRFLAAEQAALAALRKRSGTNELETARCLRRLGEAQRMLGRFGDAQDSLDRAIPVLERSPGMELKELAPALDSLGSVYLHVGAPQRARELFEASLRTRQRSGGRDETPPSLDWLGHAARSLSAPDEADELYRSAYEIRLGRETQDPTGLAESLTSLGALHLAQGDVSTGEQELVEALQLWREAGMESHPDTVPALDSLASFYTVLGDYDAARTLLERSLAIQQQSVGLESPTTFFTLDELAYVHRRRGDLMRAMALHDQLLRRYHDLSDEQVAWLFAGNAAGVPEAWLDTRGRSIRRVDRAIRVLEDRLGPDHTSVGWGSLYLAYLDDLAGKQARAEKRYARAVEVAEASSNTWLEVATFRLYAVFLYERGEVNAAILFGKRAVDALNQVVVSVATLPPARRETFERNARALFESVANWLIGAGRLPEAQQVIDRLKVFEVRTFTNGADTRAGDGDTHAALATSPAERRAVVSYNRASEEVARLSREYDAYRGRPRLSGGTGSQRGAEGAPDLVALRNALAEARAGYQRALEDARHALRASEGNEISELGSLPGHALQSSLRRLGHGAVVLHYLAMQDDLYILLTTPSTQLAKKVHVSRADLRSAVFGMLQAVKTRGRDPRPAAARLYDLVLAPMRPELDAVGARTLMIAADDALRYVPWAALYDSTSTSYLIERFAVVLYSESAQSQLERPREVTPRAAGFGLSKELDGFDRLDDVPSELDAVIRSGSSDPDGVYDGDIYLDAAFDSNALVRELESGVRVVHIASHFQFRPGSERDSFLLLGDGTRLSLGAIRERDLPFDDVDLVSLSACDTAVAASSDGREIEGFAGVVHGQGAASVVATLWKVYDPSTAAVMKRFYQSMAHGQTKAEALRTAMLTLLAPERIDAEQTTASRGSIFSHPYYWAAFLLIGNWR